MKRSSGVLMHISSLFGDYSCGGFGDEAKKFVDFLKNCGFTWWQVLPFCPVDECNSPYKSHSAFGGNPYFIDIKKLREQGIVTDAELAEQRQQTPYSCEFGRLYHTRLALLKTASKRAENRDEIENFISENKYLEQFCRFMSLKASNDNEIWTKWTCKDEDKDTLFMWKFIQFHFFKQWAEIKEYANSQGIKIIGDIPIYVAMDSADVWGNRDMFLLDERNNPTEVAGVPPDYFSEDGQLWGNPLYNWDNMKKDNFSWWKDRMSHMLAMFDGVRIDHFRAFESFWAVPFGAENARGGKWIKGPGMELVNAIKDVAKDKLIIAEDLGDITDEVRELVKKSDFPGMRVFQFGFLGSDDSVHKPHNYEENCVAYTGTHDNNTLLGYLWELGESARNNMLKYCGYTDKNWENGIESMIRTIYESHAGLVIMPIQDLLRYGSDTRLNIPGKADGNWQYRITREQLDGIDKSFYRELNGMYFR